MDDRLDNTYFWKAQEAMVKNPSTSIIYSDQQFFGESSWQWHVRQWHEKFALWEGPLPVMSIYRRRSWVASNGYSKALPFANEDWEFWLQLMQQGASAFKIPGYLVQYRYKKNSMQRNATKYQQQVVEMMRTMHPSLYSVNRLIESHEAIGKLHPVVVQSLKKKIESNDLSFRDKTFVNFWLGIIASRSGLVSLSACSLLSESALYSQSTKEPEAFLSWQGSWEYGCCLCRRSNRKLGISIIEQIFEKHPAVKSSLKANTIFFRLC